MIPETSVLIEPDEITLEEPSSQTYLIDFNENRLRLSFDTENSNGFLDGLAAMRQAVFCILNTERYEHLIYSWDYGAELQELIGMDADIVLPEIERTITEALMADSRILSVDDFEFEQNKKAVVCTFRVSTIFGDLEMEQEVIV